MNRGDVVTVAAAGDHGKQNRCRERSQMMADKPGSERERPAPCTI